MSRLVSALAIENRTEGQSDHHHDRKKKFCFLMRAYNEEQTIGKVIDEIIAAGYVHIVVVNDGSRDSTVSVVEEKIAERKAHIVLISHPINRGGGAANKTGIAFLQKHAKEMGVEWIVTFDADGQMDIADMNTFEKEIETDHHTKAFLGSRFIE